MLLRAEWVIPISSPPLRDGAVLVDGPVISAVGSFEELRREAGDDILDLGEAILLPGLVDAHSHIVYTVFRGIEDDMTLFPWMTSGILGPLELMDEEDLFYSSLLGCLEAIRAGITCLGDSGPSWASLRALREARLRGVFYKEVFQGEKAAEEALEIVLKEISREDSGTPDLVRIGISPHSPYSNGPELLRLVAEKARELGLPVSLHLAETRAELDYFLRGGGELSAIMEHMGISLPGGIGKTPASYLAELGLLGPDVLLAHCIHLTDEDVELISRWGSPVAHCPKSNAKLGSGLARVPEMISGGIRVSLGTDSTASNNILDMFEEMRMAIFLQRASREDAPVLTAEQALKMATLWGAEALGLGDRVGSLEPGKRADVVAVKIREGLLPTYDPISTLVYCASRHDVVLTMVEGRILFHEGSFTTLDKEEILKTCRSLGERIAEELG